MIDFALFFKNKRSSLFNPINRIVPIPLKTHITESKTNPENPLYIKGLKSKGSIILTIETMLIFNKTFLKKSPILNLSIFFPDKNE